MLIPVYILLLAIAARGSHVQTSEDIPEIRIYRLHTFDPPGFSITWDPIKTTIGSNPIIGIKVKVWKTPCKMTTTYQVSDQRLMKIVKYEPQTYNQSNVPDVVPEYVVIVKPDEVTATIPHIHRETWYHIRALAFTATAEGKYSNPTDFKLNSNDEADRQNSCEKIVSETPVRYVSS